MAETDLHIINNEYISCMNTLRKGKKKILRIATTNPNEEELAKDKLFQLSICCDDREVDQSYILAQSQHRTSHNIPYKHKDSRKELQNNSQKGTKKDIQDIIRVEARTFYKKNSRELANRSSLSSKERYIKTATSQHCIINTIESNEVFVASKVLRSVSHKQKRLNIIEVKPNYRMTTLPSSLNTFNSTTTSLCLSEYRFANVKGWSWGLKRWSGSSKQRQSKSGQKMRKQLLHYILRKNAIER